MATVYNLAASIKEVLELVIRNGISPTDMIHTDIYREYLELKKQGDKTEYIQIILCEKHRICRSKFYQIIKLYKREIR